jgi:hypothetical protein
MASKLVLLNQSFKSSSRLYYTSFVGLTGEQFITKALEDILGLNTAHHFLEENGPDISLFIGLMKGEIWNWDKRSYPDRKRIESVNGNLKGALLKFLFILSPTIPDLKGLDMDIQVIHVPFQILPKEIYSQIPSDEKYKRRMASNRTLKKIRKILQCFFNQSKLKSLMYSGDRGSSEGVWQNEAKFEVLDCSREVRKLCRLSLGDVGFSSFEDDESREKSPMYRLDRASSETIQVNGAKFGVFQYVREAKNVYSASQASGVTEGLLWSPHWPILCNQYIGERYGRRMVSSRTFRKIKRTLQCYLHNLLMYKLEEAIFKVVRDNAVHSEVSNSLSEPRNVFSVVEATTSSERYKANRDGEVEVLHWPKQSPSLVESYLRYNIQGMQSHSRNIQGLGEAPLGQSTSSHCHSMSNNGETEWSISEEDWREIEEQERDFWLKMIEADLREEAERFWYLPQWNCKQCRRFFSCSILDELEDIQIRLNAKPDSARLTKLRREKGEYELKRLKCLKRRTWQENVLGYHLFDREEKRGREVLFQRRIDSFFPRKETYGR